MAKTTLKKISVGQNPRPMNPASHLSSHRGFNRVQIRAEFVAGYAGQAFDLQDSLGWNGAALRPFAHRLISDSDQIGELSDAASGLNRRMNSFHAA